MSKSIKIRARSCILGAMIGDSIGSTLEFTSTNKAKKILHEHRNFNFGLIGKGPFNLLPGQFTDDSELALAIMYVINKNGEYDQNLVADAYHSWFNSSPFDIGRATWGAMSHSSAKNMINAANTINMDSLSNGFLMRQFGLVGLYYNKEYKKLLSAIIKDVKLTHGHSEAKKIAVFYGIILFKAIQGQTANNIYKWGKIFIGHSDLITALYGAVDTNSDSFVYDNKKFKISDIDSQYCGFVGFALWLLLKCLKEHTNYKHAIINIISLGGDTDTNACIVGAVMGALYPDTIPSIWINDLYNCKALDRYNKYPIADPKVWTQWLP